MDILTCDECHLLIDGEYANFNGRSYHKDCFVCQFCQKPLSSQFTSHDGKYYHSECVDNVMGKKCFKCGDLIRLSMGQRAFTIDGHQIHHSCFKCSLCQKELPGKYFEKNGEYYDEECFDRQFVPKCTKCTKNLRKGEPYFSLKDKQFHSECFTCISCNHEIGNQGFKEQADGTYICKQCLASKVADAQSKRTAALLAQEPDHLKQYISQQQSNNVSGSSVAGSTSPMKDLRQEIRSRSSSNASDSPGTQRATRVSFTKVNAPIIQNFDSSPKTQKKGVPPSIPAKPANIEAPKPAMDPSALSKEDQTKILMERLRNQLGNISGTQSPPTDYKSPYANLPPASLPPKTAAPANPTFSNSSLSGSGSRPNLAAPASSVANSADALQSSPETKLSSPRSKSVTRIDMTQVRNPENQRKALPSSLIDAIQSTSIEDLKSAPGQPSIGKSTTTSIPSAPVRPPGQSQATPQSNLASSGKSLSNDLLAQIRSTSIENLRRIEADDVNDTSTPSFLRESTGISGELAGAIKKSLSRRSLNEDANGTDTLKQTLSKNRLSVAMNQASPPEHDDDDWE